MNILVKKDFLCTNVFISFKQIPMGEYPSHKDDMAKGAGVCACACPHAGVMEGG